MHFKNNKKSFNIKNNHQKTKIAILIAMVLLFIYGIYAAVSYFQREKAQKINVAKDIPIFNIDKVAGGNVESHKLLPRPIPLLDDDHYAYVVDYFHEAKLDTKHMANKKPLYLKIKTRFETNNTLANPDNYFVSAIHIEDSQGKLTTYDNANRPEIVLDRNHKGKVKVKFEVEATNVPQTNNKDLDLDLVAIYNIVDEQGNDISGSAETIKTAIAQKAV